jgi:hypothetical protein
MMNYGKPYENIRIIIFWSSLVVHNIIELNFLKFITTTKMSKNWTSKFQIFLYSKENECRRKFKSTLF